MENAIKISEKIAISQNKNVISDKDIIKSLKRIVFVISGLDFSNNSGSFSIMFSVILLRSYKESFDLVLKNLIKSFDKVPSNILKHAASASFAAFPALNTGPDDHMMMLPINFMSLNSDTAPTFKPSSNKRSLRLFEGERRKEMKQILRDRPGETLSKILNTQGFVLSDLRLSAAGDCNLYEGFHRSV